MLKYITLASLFIGIVGCTPDQGGIEYNPDTYLCFQTKYVASGNGPTWRTGKTWRAPSFEQCRALRP